MATLAISCRDLPDLAGDYVDRSGPRLGRLRVFLHIGTCPNCRAYVRGLGRVKSLARSAFIAETPSSDLVDRLVEGAGNRSTSGEGAP